MNCRIADLKDKDIVNIKDGVRLGYINDIEVDTTNAKLISIIIFGKQRLFGLLGREDDIVIEWNDIEVIGTDTVLVNCEYARFQKPSHLGTLKEKLGNKRFFA